MQDFRILGTLEVIGVDGPVALGGPRQRALLAALLLRVGRVVPTEQLVDELYGAEPPKTAIASLQNSVAALRKALGPDVLVTRSPGYVLTLLPEQIDARRFEQILADARAASAEERRALLVRALDLWRGPPLAEFAFEEWAQTEARRLDELRAVAVEERIATEVELGRAADVVPELESLVRQHPLRERLRELLMLALYRAGRQAEALGAYTEARATLDELGIEPGDKLRHLQAAILRHDPGLSARSDADELDADAAIVKAILSGRLVPVLGLDGAADLAAGLASVFGYPSERPLEHARGSHYVANKNRSGPL
jgi:DNA-binding SARP family transcriptional activator